MSVLAETSNRGRAVSLTEAVIRDQFPFLRKALNLPMPQLGEGTLVFVGCGTSYYLARTLASVSNLLGRSAVAVPGAEWTAYPQAHLASESGAIVIGLSRSGTTTETVAAVRASRSRGLKTIAISCEPDSTILEAAETPIYLPTDRREGIVMSVSATLMLLAGLRLLGASVTGADIDAAKASLEALDRGAEVIEGREHFVFLGAGPLYGIACEGALKLMEMSLNPAQPFHPMEYRHGPVSLITNASLVVQLYSAGTATEEAALSAELQSKGARVIGFGGPGDLSIGDSTDAPTAALRVLPALQLLGEKVALARNIDTETPRHLTKVVVLN
jgi:glutamine---fructose-6-phosphate transaminase (isomerizing)